MQVLSKRTNLPKALIYTSKNQVIGVMVVISLDMDLFEVNTFPCSWVISKVNGKDLFFFLDFAFELPKSL